MTVRHVFCRGIPSGFLDEVSYSSTYREDSDGQDLRYSYALVKGRFQEGTEKVMDSSFEGAMSDLTSTLSLEGKDRHQPIFWVASNCSPANGRTKLVRELMKVSRCMCICICVYLTSILR